MKRYRPDIANMDWFSFSDTFGMEGYDFPVDEATVVGEGPRLPQFAVPPDWSLASECIESDAHKAAFTHNGKLVTNKAKAECLACPVRAQCLEQALRLEGDTPSRMRFGIFGALTPTERFSLYEERGGTQPHNVAESAPYAPTEVLSA